ncbi:MAG TPA: hypothetical protein VM345_03380 [Acidimicrobiales bacterium]|jgi:hypothetical protein|nr:hypothetical protein [Acidimicrobiales bacterium]
MFTLIGAVEWSNGIEDAWSRTVAFVPKFLGFLLILAIGYLVAKTLATALDKILERTGFDRAVERGGIRQALAKSRYDASDIVSKVVFYGLMLFVLQLAFGIFGTNPVSDLIAGVIAFLPKLVVAIVIIVVASAIAAAVKDIVTNALSGLSYGRTLATAASVSILVLGAFMALNQIEIAPEIVNALFYAILAVVVGSAIVAIGGGGIQPMRARWERAMQRWDEEQPRVRREVESARMQREAEAERQRQIDLRDQTVLAETEPVDSTNPMTLP